MEANCICAQLPANIQKAVTLALEKGAFRSELGKPNLIDYFITAVTIQRIESLNKYCVAIVQHFKNIGFPCKG